MEDLFVSKDQLDREFTYHAPTIEQALKYDMINSAAKHLCEVILTNCPPSADRSAAIRKIREARMTANASIACAPAPPTNMGGYAVEAQGPAETIGKIDR